LTEEEYKMRDGLWAKSVVIGIILLFIGTSVLPFIGITSSQQYKIKIENTYDNHIEKIIGQPYNGFLRVYIVEPISRWDNNDRVAYHFGFLDFAINEQVSIEYLDTYIKHVTWNAQQAGFSNVQENNVMVIAAVFNPEIHKGYAYPPSRNPFDAHFVDAAAGATPGHTGSNIVKENFTHTVFVEEATAQYCPYCPAMAEALNNISKSGDYPFYFVALIAKNHQGNVINSVALDYLINNYNFYGYPTAFFDGGRKVLVGGYDQESYYRTRIEQCGKTDVHEMDLNLSVVWKGNGVIDIAVSIFNKEEMPNGAPSTPTLTGPSSGKLKKEYSFNVTTTDPEGDQVWYWIDWGDGTNTSWIGPFASGTGITQSHTWSAKGNYTITAKAKDTAGHESDWATLTVTMPYSYVKPIPKFYDLLFQRFPNAFPLLRQLMGY
jgi:thiol-disulfide isomerase/thioredoxin